MCGSFVGSQFILPSTPEADQANAGLRQVRKVLRRRAKAKKVRVLAILGAVLIWAESASLSQVCFGASMNAINGEDDLRWSWKLLTLSLL